MNWTWTTQPNDLWTNDGLVEEVDEVFQDGFGLKTRWGAVGIKKRMQEASLVGLLREQEASLAGYAFYTMPPILLGDGWLLWEDAICLRLSSQGQGHSNAASILRAAQELFPERPFAWFGGRTQNPGMFRRYEKLGKLYPFDLSFASNDGMALLEFMVAHVPEVTESVPTLERSTGICRRVYHEGRLGSYDETRPEFEQFEKHLTRVGFRRENGDALVVVAKIAS